MKEIRAICRPNRLHALREALRQVPGFPGLTVLEARGFSAPALVDHPTLQEALTDFAREIMICMLVADNMVDEIVDIRGRQPRAPQPCAYR